MAITTYGTLQVSDLLTSTNQTVYQLGEDNAYGAIANDLVTHNRWFADMVTDFGLLRTTDRVRRYGGSASMQVEDLDEHSAPDSQKNGEGIDIGFPLYRKGLAVQWTRDYFRRAQVAEFAAQFQSAQDADVRGLETAVKKALLTATSNTSYKDRLVDGTTLPVRAFLNADSVAIPNGPNGETFTASSHTHYNGYASSAVAAADVTGLITNVTEHGVDGKVKLLINSAQEATIRGFTADGQFTAYVDARIVQANSTSYAGGVGLDVNNPNDRPIGIYGAAEVWVKPWIPANYWVCMDTGDGNNRPLVMRIPTDAAFADFQVLADDESYPLRARFLAREYGVAPWQRQKVAVLYGGGTSYVTPTL
jgi:hypothetical protein